MRSNGETKSRELLLGSLDEMKFWTRIVFEHLKFHRQAVDPGNDRAFYTMHQFATSIEFFYNTSIFPVPESSSSRLLQRLSEETLEVIIPARNFKAQLKELIESCCLLSLIDPLLADHLRRETDYFIGQVRYSLGKSTPTRDVLGLPGGSKRVLTVPRRIMPTLRDDMLAMTAIDNIMFFSRTHGEHAHHITLVVRPEIQEDIRLKAKRFEELLFANIDKAAQVENTGVGLNELVSSSLELAVNFRDFTFFVNDALHHCAVPTGRVNAWPLLADHIAREAQYFVDVLNRISSGNATPPPNTPIYPYIV
jgi:Domain of unknown function (DUF2935)